MSGVRSANGRAFARTVRSTLVLERREDGRWQIVHEHSSPVEPGRPAFGEGAHAEE
jgi:ketosteroid isomerase-like protein